MSLDERDCGHSLEEEKRECDTIAPIVANALKQQEARVAAKKPEKSDFECS